MDTTVIRTLLENGANVHEENEFALLTACRMGQLVTIHLLLENGADVYNEENGSFLQHAAECGQYEVVKLLLEYGTQHQDQALLQAIKSGHIDIVRLLFENGAENAIAFTVACESGHPEIVKFLFEKTAKDDFEKVYWSFGTAARCGRVEIVRLLIDLARPRTKLSTMKKIVSSMVFEDSFLALPLIEASGYGQIEVVRFLIEQKANLNLYGSVAVGAARLAGHHDIVELLEKEMKKVHFKRYFTYFRLAIASILIILTSFRQIFRAIVYFSRLYLGWGNPASEHEYYARLRMFMPIVTNFIRLYFARLVRKIRTYFFEKMQAVKGLFGC